MKRRVAIGMTVCLVWCSVGCSTHRPFVSAVAGYADAILPEYIAYVQNDAALNQDSKRIRTQSARKFRKLIDEAMESNQK